jgi:hypothetical protein
MRVRAELGGATISDTKTPGAAIASTVFLRAVIEQRRPNDSDGCVQDRRPGAAAVAGGCLCE